MVFRISLIEFSKLFSNLEHYYISKIIYYKIAASKRYNLVIPLSLD